MKAASSGNNTIPCVARVTIASIAGALILIVGLASFPNLRAETPPDPIQAAGAIPLTTELLDKMEKFINSVSADAGAKEEVAAVGKDPSVTPETWGSAISAKCPKAVAIFKGCGLTPDEFGKGIITLLAVGLSEDDLTKSRDKTVRHDRLGHPVQSRLIAKCGLPRRLLLPIRALIRFDVDHGYDNRRKKRGRQPDASTTQASTRQPFRLRASNVALPATAAMISSWVPQIRLKCPPSSRPLIT
jgi:hypothetical protein